MWLVRTLGPGVRWLVSVTAVVQVLLPACLLVCGPISADEGVQNHHAEANGTRCLAHEEPQDSEGSQVPDALPSCERTHSGVALTRSGPENTFSDTSQRCTYRVFDQLLGHSVLNARVSVSTLTIHSIYPPPSPLVASLRL